MTANNLTPLQMAAMYAAFAFLPAFLQTPRSDGYGFGASITESGLMILPQAVFMFLLGLASGRIGARFGSKTALIAGSAIGAVSNRPSIAASAGS